MASALDVANLTKHFDAMLAVDDVSFTVQPATICALLGPSGSGKTTLLRIIAGLETADHGSVRLGDTALTDVAAGVAVAPERRHIGMVFQDGAVFPHLDVRTNVAFGLPRRTGRPEIDRIVDGVLDLVGLTGFGDRRPGTLSGGQLQRVALARALAPRPEMLLFDEPFSSLDVALKVQVRRDLHRLLVESGTTAVFVTHDQDEAFVMADRILVMCDGRVVQHGTPREVYANPATAWVATFVGDANLVAGELRDGVVTTALGRSPAATTVATAAAPSPTALATNDDVVALLRPERIVLASDGAGAAGTVVLVEFHGHDQVAVVRLDTGGEIRVRRHDAPVIRGDRVVAAVDRDPVVVYPRT
jgi:iron(III) transport system ATP-binding protein